MGKTGFIVYNDNFWYLGNLVHCLLVINGGSSVLNLNMIYLEIFCLNVHLTFDT